MLQGRHETSSVLKTTQIFGATVHNLIAWDLCILDLKEFVIALPVVYYEVRNECDGRFTKTDNSSVGRTVVNQEVI